MKEEIRSTAIFAVIFLVIVKIIAHQTGAITLGCLVASFVFLISIMGKKIPWTIFMVINPSLMAIAIEVIKEQKARIFDIVFLMILATIMIVTFNLWALSTMNRVREKYYPKKPDLKKMKERFFFCQGTLFLLLTIISLIL